MNFNYMIKNNGEKITVILKNIKLHHLSRNKSGNSSMINLINLKNNLK